MLIAWMMKQLGHEAAIMANGKQGIEMVQNRVYDFVFKDIQMPALDGLEATCVVNYSKQADKCSHSSKDNLRLQW